MRSEEAAIVLSSRTNRNTLNRSRGSPDSGVARLKTCAEARKVAISTTSPLRFADGGALGVHEALGREDAASDEDAQKQHGQHEADQRWRHQDDALGDAQPAEERHREHDEGEIERLDSYAHLRRRSALNGFRSEGSLRRPASSSPFSSPGLRKSKSGSSITRVPRGSSAMASSTASSPCANSVSS